MQDHLIDLFFESLKALLWMTIGAIPIIIGFGANIWANQRALKKSLNSAHQKIRDIYAVLPQAKCSKDNERKEDR